MSRHVALLIFALELFPIAIRADDFGPPRTVGQVRAESRRLLARQVRASGADPKNLAIADVVVSGDQALLTWDFGAHHGLMGLVHNDDRWWDAWDAGRYGGCWQMLPSYPILKDPPAYPQAWIPPDYEPPPAAAILQETFGKELASAAALHNADVRASTDLWQKANPAGPGHLVKPIGCDADTYPLEQDTVVHPAGGTVSPPRFQTSGYALTLTYAANDASAARFKQVYFRPPTPAEFLPNHPLAPGWGYANAVCFFDIAIDGAKPVDVKPGTVIDVWFPFVLDDQLRYSISFFSNDRPSGLIKGTIFDNTVHFVLPAFTLAPGKPLMAEIDGDPMSH